MIKYQLRCDGAHEFEGWFQSSAAFDDQSARGLVSCPTCGSIGVKRALMTPNLASPKTRKDNPMNGQGDALPAETPATAPATAPVSAPASGPRPSSMPPSAPVLSPAAAEKMQDLVADMRELQAKIKAECRDVGTDFAEEARKIHYGEAEPKGIYGQATSEEREALDEEGIDVVDIPWLPPDN